MRIAEEQVRYKSIWRVRSKQQSEQYRLLGDKIGESRASKAEEKLRVANRLEVYLRLGVALALIQLPGCHENDSIAYE